MKSIILLTALLISTVSFAQKKDKKEKKEKSEKTFYKESTIETDDYKAYIIDGVATEAYSKFKLKVFNKTNDYILIKPSEFIYTNGSKTVTNTEKDFLIAPNEEESKVIDFKGAELQTEKYSIELKGFYKASAGGKIIEYPTFDLPPVKNDITANNVSCVVKKFDIDTDKSVVKFDCQNSGETMVIVNPSKTTLIMPNGSENANSKRNRPILLSKGQSDDFMLLFNEVKDAGDMKKGPLKIKWNSTFRETKLMPLKASKVEVIQDTERK